MKENQTHRNIGPGFCLGCGDRAKPQPDPGPFSTDSGDVKTNSFLALSCGVYPVCLEDETNAFSDMAMRFLARAGMVEKDERMILIEDESHDAMPETLLMKNFKVRTGGANTRRPVLSAEKR